MIHKIATLIYGFNERDEALLMQRLQEPNYGLWSPPGGKLDTASGESPYQCAIREAREEIGVELAASDLHLAGLVTESGHAGAAHWMMFLFEVKRKLRETPPPHREGTFQFFSRENLKQLPMPETDREQIWPLFWEQRGGFFAAHCEVKPSGANQWTALERA